MNPIATVQTAYEAFGRGDVPAILALLAPDIAWEHDAKDHGIPWLRPGRGPAHVERFFRELQAIEITRFEPQNFLAGGRQVAVPIRLEGRVRATGRTFAELEMHLWTFGENGRVIAFRHFVDTHQNVLDMRGE